MPQPSGKALTNESNYPNVVELAVSSDGLSVKQIGSLDYGISQSRHIEPRHGRIISMGDQSITAGAFLT